MKRILEYFENKHNYIWSSTGLTLVLFGVQGGDQIFGAGNSLWKALPVMILSAAAFFVLLLVLGWICDNGIDGVRVTNFERTGWEHTFCTERGNTPRLRSKIYRVLYKYRGVFLNFMVLNLIWGLFYVMCFPGNTTWDTGGSILYHLGIDRRNVNNPYFQNIVFGSAYQFGEILGDARIGIAVFCSLQFLSYLTALSYFIAQIGRKSQIIKYMLLLIYMMVPAFPIYALTMGKDSNFALVVLIYTGLAFEMVSDSDSFYRKKSRPFILGISVVLIGLFRNKAATIPAVAVLCYALFVDRKKRSYCFAVTVIVITIFMNHVFPVIIGTPKGEIREALSIPLQQTGYYVNSFRDEVTPDEYRKIDAVIPFDALEQYDPSISDPIKNRFKNDATSKELLDYFGVWLAQLKKHPGAYLKAFYLHTYGYYIPSANKSDIKRHTFIGFVLNTSDIERLKLRDSNTNRYLDLVMEIDNVAMQIPIYSLFSKIGIYTWLLLISIVRIIQTRKWQMFICIAPAVMVLIGCLFSPVNGYYRYAFSMILSVPVIFANTVVLKPN